MTPQLNFLGLHSDHIGYGIHYLATLDALRSAGIDVYDGLPGSGDEALDTKRAKVCKDILFLTLPTHVRGWHEGQRAHLFTMWETNRLPEALRNVLHHFETILVPSEANAEMYRNYHDNVHVVPLGIDGELWHFQERRNDAYFNFLTLGSGPRKGADLTHKAFLELFGDGAINGGPIPQLFVKSAKGLPFDGSGVHTISGHMSTADLVGLYASAHCYVGPSRGEGWGMQPTQAIAQGCPTILTDAHGHASFARYGIPISASMVPAEHLSMWGDSGSWWEPNYEELRDAMLSVYLDYENHVDRARQQSADFIRDFSWQRSAEAILDAIGGHETLSQRFRPSEIPDSWKALTPKKFRVVTKRKWRADIGGIVYEFEKGVEYVETADVKRVLFEADLLDERCLNDLDGLTSEQIERLALKSSAMRRCETCEQVIPWDEDEEDERALLAS